MDMGMKLDFLVPGVEHAEEADLGAEILGITSHFEQCLGTGLKQEMVEDLFVVQGVAPRDVVLRRRVIIFCPNTDDRDKSVNLKMRIAEIAPGVPV